MQQQVQNSIKIARVAKNLSQEQLAGLVDVTRQTINAMENGEYNPSVLLALKLSQVLEKSVHELFYLTQSVNEKNK